MVFSRNECLVHFEKLDQNIIRGRYHDVFHITQLDHDLVEGDALRFHMLIVSFEIIRLDAEMVDAAGARHFG